MTKLPLDEKVNCRVLNHRGGSNTLVFTIDGTGKSVGEIHFVGDPQYLLAMSEMFSRWANIKRGQLITSMLNGHGAG